MPTPVECDRNDIETLDDLDAWVLDEYDLDLRDQGLAPTTVKARLSTLRVFLKYCESIGAVEDGLHESIDIPTLSKSEEASEVRLAQEDAVASLEFFRDSRRYFGTAMHAFLEVIWHTGARMGSIRGLDRSDYDSERQYLQFVHRPSTGTPLKNDDDGQRPDDVAPGVSNRCRRDAHVDQRPVFALALCLVAGDRVGVVAEQSFAHLLHCGLLFGGNGREWFADHLLGGPPEQPFGGRIPPLYETVFVDENDRVRRRLDDRFQFPCRLFELPFALRALARGGRLDVGLYPVGQQCVLDSPASFLPEIRRDARLDRLGSHLFGLVVREQNERQVGVVLADCIEKFQAVRVGQLILADDTVDGLGVETGERLGSAVFGDDVEVVAFPFEALGGEFRTFRVVVDVKDSNWAGHGSAETGGSDCSSIFGVNTCDFDRLSPSQKPGTASNRSLPRRRSLVGRSGRDSNRGVGRSLQ